MARQADLTYMQRALELARKGRFKTAPNPMVGAVIVKNGRIIGEGYHHRAGSAHAEIVALKSATGPVNGASLYVTLEPCNHTGRTGPCTEAIIDSGIDRVVFAATDPDPRVQGRGARRLRRAGIKVESGILREEATRLNEIYFGYLQLKRPYIVLKTAQTLDGRIATSTGDSQWISGPQSRRMAHELRAECDGVIVGAETVRRDNPALTVRHIKGPDPYRIILTASAQFPKKSRVLDINSDFRTIIATTAENVERFSKTLRGRKLIYWAVKTGRDHSLDIADLVRQANQFGLRSLLVEGGSRVSTSFLKARLVDKVVAFIAPKISGEGINAIGDLRIRRIADVVTLTNTETMTLGKDLVFVGYPKWSA